MRFVFSSAAIALAILLPSAGCYSVKSLSKVPERRLAGEGTVVFTRPEQYTPLFGSHSPREYFEVAYERFSRNAAGQAVVEVGIRYRGGVHWTDWHRSMPQNVTIGARCNFYDTPSAQAGGAIVYSTNRERIVLQRGETYPYRATCPVLSAAGYQLVLGE